MARKFSGIDTGLQISEYANKEIRKLESDGKMAEDVAKGMTVK